MAVPGYGSTCQNRMNQLIFSHTAKQFKLKFINLHCECKLDSWLPARRKKKGLSQREKVWIPAEMNPRAPNAFCNCVCVRVSKVERETHKAVACWHSLQLLYAKNHVYSVVARNAGNMAGVEDWEWDLKMFPSDPTAPITSPPWFKSRQQLAQHLKNFPLLQDYYLSWLCFSWVWPPSPGS